MITEEAIRQTKARLKDYLEAVTEHSVNAGFYACPLCGSGTKEHKTGALKLYEETNTFNCFSCKAGGDVFKLAAMLNNLDNKRDFKEVYKVIMDTLGEHTHTVNTLPPRPPLPPKQQAKADYSEYIKDCCKAVNETRYLADRGFTQETIERFRLGYDEKKQMVIIPYNKECSYYIGRSVRKAADDKGDKKHFKPKTSEAGGEPVFNAGVIQAAIEKKQPVFICEAPMDAISVMQAGGLALAIGGTGEKKLANLLGSTETLPAFIIATDTDEAGEAAAKTLQQIFKEKNVRNIRFKLGAYKDVNAYLMADAAALTNAVKDAIETALETPLSAYNKTSTAAQLDGFIQRWESESSNAFPTGFAELDKIICGGLCPANFYVIGAVSSMGKTTFCLQIVDSLAKRGVDVLYFALEQPVSVLVAKSLSRMSYELADTYTTPNAKQANAQTSDSFVSPEKRKNWTPSVKALVKGVIKEYKQFAGNVFMIGQRRLTANDILEHIAKHITLRKKKPVVFIDFLQLLVTGDTTADSNTRTRVEISLDVLKTACETFQIPIIAISSFNRASYNLKADMSAFKESGAIEYSAEVVMALQPAALCDDDVKDAEKQNKAYIQRIKQMPEGRDMEIAVLKNRTGGLGSSYYSYNAKYNHFEECEAGAPAKLPAEERDERKPL